LSNINICSQTSQSPVTDLFVDLQDGDRLLSLLELLTGKQYVSNVTPLCIRPSFFSFKMTLLCYEMLNFAHQNRFGNKQFKE